jgi:hypothetical protein
MATILDYLYWRGDVPFSCSPFNDVDNLILSEFTYLALEKALPEGGRMTVHDLYDALKDCPGAFGFISQEENSRMLAFMGEGRRYCDAEVCCYHHETDMDLQKQFAAMTFLLPDGTAYIAFRGTDNTLVGWKEDLHVLFMPSAGPGGSACLPGQGRGSVSRSASGGRPQQGRKPGRLCRGLCRGGYTEPHPCRL